MKEYSTQEKIEAVKILLSPETRNILSGGKHGFDNISDKIENEINAFTGYVRKFENFDSEDCVVRALNAVDSACNRFGKDMPADTDAYSRLPESFKQALEV